MHAELPLDKAFRALYECGWRAFEVATEHLEAVETDAEIPGECHPVPELRRLKRRFALHVAEWLVGLAAGDQS